MLDWSKFKLKKKKFTFKENLIWKKERKKILYAYFVIKQLSTITHHHHCESFFWIMNCDHHFQLLINSSRIREKKNWLWNIFLNYIFLLPLISMMMMMMGFLFYSAYVIDKNFNLFAFDSFPFWEKKSNFQFKPFLYTFFSLPFWIIGGYV